MEKLPTGRKNRTVGQGIGQDESRNRSIRKPSYGPVRPKEHPNPPSFISLGPTGVGKRNWPAASRAVRFDEYKHGLYRHVWGFIP